MSKKPFACFALSLLCVAPMGLSAETPVAVSPGSAIGSVIGDTCPTFSWGAVPGAENYDLVVYRLGSRRAESQPALSQRISGSALGWTPSLDRCLRRGGRYAWSVRAIGGEQTSDWSQPSLFQVASGPSAVEFEEALMVVRQYLASQNERGADAQSWAETHSEATRDTSVEPPAPLAPPDTLMSVDGNVDATSFSGSGSLLTDLDPKKLLDGSAVAVANGGTGATTAAEARTNLGVVAGPHTVDEDTTCLDGGVVCNFAAAASEGGAAMFGDSATGFFAFGQIEEPRISDEIARDSEVIATIAAVDRECPGALGSGNRYTDCGNGTVRDNSTGVLWLKDASCDSLGPNGDGTATWSEGEAAVEALADGTCGLTDDSSAGDWRQPTPTEFCSAWTSFDLNPCPASAASDSLIDSSVGPPTVVNAAGTGVWTAGDAFVGVTFGFYWSDFTSGGNRFRGYLLSGSVSGTTDSLAVSFIWPVRAGL
jgi:hypothetical protein